MAVDLKTSGLFHRSSAVIRDEDLVLLDHQSTKDRVRRVAFDRVEHVLHWRSLPWGRMVLYLALFGIPGVLLAVQNEPVVPVFGWILITGVVVIELRYLYARQSHIRISRAGNDYMIKGVLAPRKTRRFLDRLEAAIRRTQEKQNGSPTPVAVDGESPSTGPAPPPNDELSEPRDV